MTKRPPARRASRARTFAITLAAALLVAGCGRTSSPSPSGSPEPTPGPSKTPVGVEHPTGARDVVLRFEEGGGFVPMGFLAGQAPIFTLYGDGTVIFRDFSRPQPVRIGDAQPQIAFETVRLTEEEIQDLLDFALAPGALGIARASYVQGGVADAPTSIFTIAAGGLTKTVSVNGLGFDNEQNPDRLILKQLASLGERLRGFNAVGATVWSPDRYRGILSPDAFGNAREWPWPNVKPSDFHELKLANGFTWNARTMSPAEIAALKMSGIKGGVLNVVLAGPGDGNVYSFTLRPLLPDETA